MFSAQLDELCQKGVVLRSGCLQIFSACSTQTLHRSLACSMSWAMPVQMIASRMIEHPTAGLMLARVKTCQAAAAQIQPLTAQLTDRSSPPIWRHKAGSMQQNDRACFACMQVSFVKGTHYVFTTGKDGALKYWDADRWELLLSLGGHRGESWALAVSSLGDFAVTGVACSCRCRRHCACVLSHSDWEAACGPRSTMAAWLAPGAHVGETRANPSDAFCG